MGKEQALQEERASWGKEKHLQRGDSGDRTEFEGTQRTCHITGHCLEGQHHHFRFYFVLTKGSQSIFPSSGTCERSGRKKLKIGSTFSPSGCAKRLRIQRCRAGEIKPSARCLVFLPRNPMAPELRLEDWNGITRIRRQRKAWAMWAIALSLHVHNSSCLLELCWIAFKCRQITYYNAWHLVGVQ